VPLCQALTAVRAESFSNGMEQLREGFGEADERIWNEKYSPFLANPANVRKLELANDPTVPNEMVMQHRILVSMS
jgi:hypothetical protein